jgi:hypothetical protein
MNLFHIAEPNGIWAGAWHHLAQMSNQILPHHTGNGNNNTSYYLLPLVLSRLEVGTADRREIGLHFFPPKCACTNEGRNSFISGSRETTEPETEQSL